MHRGEHRLPGDRRYYNSSSVTAWSPGIFALQCGDPTGTSRGTPCYQFADENLPAGKSPAYRAGDVAMANRGPGGTNGGQFFFVWGTSDLQGDYSLFGRVTKGLDIIQRVGAGGDDGAFEADAGGGHPTIKLLPSAPSPSVPWSKPTSIPVPA